MVVSDVCTEKWKYVTLFWRGQPKQNSSSSFTNCSALRQVTLCYSVTLYLLLPLSVSCLFLSFSLSSLLSLSLSQSLSVHLPLSRCTKSSKYIDTFTFMHTYIDTWAYMSPYLTTLISTSPSLSLPILLPSYLHGCVVSIIGELEEQFKALPESKSEKMNFRTTYPNRVRRDPRFSRWAHTHKQTHTYTHSRTHSYTHTYALTHTHS
jgi:hypothetical protein